MINIFKTLLGITSGQDEKLVNKREALTKERCMALSTATMTILVKSHPLKEKLTVTSPEKLNQYPTSTEYLRPVLG